MDNKKRNIIKIDENLCNGCGVCVKGCHEGALQIIDGKAQIISELYCDGLGACIGDCPVNSISIENRIAEPYDEIAVMERISKKGEKTIIAHLKHLKDHNENLYLEQGIHYLKSNNINVNLDLINDKTPKIVCGCPGSVARSFVKSDNLNLKVVNTNENRQSELTHWPVQLYLLNPDTTYFYGADVVLAADCTAYAFADFHKKCCVAKNWQLLVPNWIVIKMRILQS